jgi:lipid-A-disaccharide synthase-like uncharacterized protein
MGIMFSKELMAWLYFNTCIATIAWLSTGLSLLILFSLAYMLNLIAISLELKLESKDLLLARVWHSIDLIPRSLAYSESAVYGHVDG